jgi:hypothetical protein
VFKPSLLEAVLSSLAVMAPLFRSSCLGFVVALLLLSASDKCHQGLSYTLSGNLTVAVECIVMDRLYADVIALLVPMHADHDAALALAQVGVVAVAGGCGC